MNNPIKVSRQYLYDKITARSTFMTLVSNNFFKRRPTQAVVGPFGFLSQASPRGMGTVGTRKLSDNGLWDINLIIGRDQQLSVLESMVDEACEAIHVTQSLQNTGTGLVSGCTVEDIYDIPYDIGADEIPRQIVRARVYASGS